MSGFSLTYRLVQFDEASKHDKAFEKAINIYFNETAPEIRTDPDEIRRCRFNYSDKYHQNKIVQFGLFMDKEVIGFSRLAHFHLERVIFIDYVTISKEYRRWNTFYSFIDLMRGYVHQTGLMYDFIVTEIAYLSQDGTPALESRALVRKLKSQGFLVADYPYEQPQLGVHTPETQMRAWLLISPRREEVDGLPSATFKKIVNTTYCDHYLKWYELMLKKDDVEEYVKIINFLSEDLGKKLKKRTFVKLIRYRDVGGRHGF